MKTIEEAYHPTKDIKKAYFEELRDLNKKYAVEIYSGEVEWHGVKCAEDIEMIPAIYFEFHDGSTYTWSDGILEPEVCNTFENVDGNEVISVNGI